MAKKDTSSKALLKGTGIVGLLTAASRVLGFCRDLIFALIFGAGSSADAFFVAFRVPNLMRSIVAEGALTSAFVPVFTDTFEKGEEETRKALRQSTSLILTMTLVLALLGIFFADAIISFLAPGFSAEKISMSSQLLQVMIPIIIALSLVSMINGALNTVHIFGAAPLAQIGMNITLIVGGLSTYLVEEEQKIYLLSYWVLLGGALQVCLQYPALKKAGFSILPSPQIITPVTKAILTLMIPAVFGAAIYQISIILNTILASLLEDGSVSWLFYADRVAQLPIGIFTVALSSVLLPLLARSASSSDNKDYSETTVNALRYVSFVLIPVSITLFLFAPDLIQLLLERGAFTEETTRMTALALQGYAIGLWGISCQSILSRSFIAKKDPLTPALVGLVALAIGFHFSIIFMGDISTQNDSSFATWISHYQEFIGNWIPLQDLGHVGLALSSSATSITAAILLLILFRYRESDADLSPFVRSSIQALLAGGILSVVTLFADSLSFFFTIPLGFLLYFASSFLLRSQESTEIVNVVK